MAEYSNLLGPSSSPADGACVQMVFSYAVGTSVVSMGESLGGHRRLESWNDLRLLDLAFSFLNFGTKAKECI